MIEMKLLERIKIFLLLAISLLASSNSFAMETDSEKLPLKRISASVRFLGKIVYQKHSKGCILYVMNGDIGENKQLASVAYCKQISWSPNGEIIAYTDDENIYVIKSNDGLVKKVTDFNKGVTSKIEWLDNSSIQFNHSRNRDGSSLAKGAYKVNISSGEIVKAERFKDDYSYKYWNEERNKYIQFEIAPSRFEVYNQDGRLYKVIEGGPLGEIYRWSPDSRWVMYCEGCPYENVYPNNIRILNLDTGNSYLIDEGDTVDWFYTVPDDLKTIVVLFKDKTYHGNNSRYSLDLIETLISGKTNAYKRLTVSVLRNEIFARHGRQFKSPELQYVYGVTDWYKPNQNYSDDMLNDIEKKNVQFLLDYEKKMGWR